jgi:cytochrome c oxidase subunit 2
MNFEVRAVSPEDFDTYVQAREGGASTFDALEEIGQPGRATTTHPYDIGDRSQQASDG